MIWYDNEMFTGILVCLLHNWSFPLETHKLEHPSETSWNSLGRWRWFCWPQRAEDYCRHPPRTPPVLTRSDEPQMILDSCNRNTDLQEIILRLELRDVCWIFVKQTRCDPKLVFSKLNYRFFCQTLFLSIKNQFSLSNVL